MNNTAAEDEQGQHNQQSRAGSQNCSGKGFVNTAIDTEFLTGLLVVVIGLYVEKFHPARIVLDAKVFVSINVAGNRRQLPVSSIQFILRL